MKGLYKGERDAISLAINLKASVLLMDEKKGSKVARERNLIVARTTVVIEEAGRNGLLDPEKAI